MNLLKTSAAFAAAMMVWSGQALAAPVDLSTWTAEGGNSNWVLQSGNNAVKQFVNGEPTVFHNGVNSQGLALSGTIEVQTTADNDYIGFVLGYNTGDFSNATADYLLIDWKQANQNFFGLGLEGLSISQVSGVLGDNSGAWSHDPANNVTELQRATNLGSTGWDDNTSYAFDLIFTASAVQVRVDGVLELSIGGSFNNGSFGFYNYSQRDVLYAGIEEVIAPPTIPLPAALPLMATALMGMGFLNRRRKKSAIG